MLKLVSFVTALLGAAKSDMMLTLFERPTGALCTDGTQAGFYFEPSASGNTSKWVIELEGGGICESNQDCLDRQDSDLGSSKNWGATITMGPGQLSVDPLLNPDFHDWNHVFVPYCSGDVWLGEQVVRTDPWANVPKQSSNSANQSNSSAATFVFTGHVIVKAVVAELKAYVGEGVVSELLLEGCSAGGLGTLANADWVAEQLPDAKVRANPQCGWFGLAINDYQHWVTNTTDPDPHHFRDNGWVQRIRYYRPPAVDACLADDPTADAAICGEPPRYYPFTTVPMFISENTADSYQVFVQGGCPSDLAAADAVGFVGYVRGLLASSLRRTVLEGTRKPGDGLFAPACLAHGLAWTGAQAPTIGSRTHQQAMGDWYYDRGRTHRYLDDAGAIDTLLSCGDVGRGTASADRLVSAGSHPLHGWKLPERW